MGKLKAVGLGVKALEDAFKAEQAAEKMYTAADRAKAGNKAAELIKTQPQVKASEALGNLMEKGFKKVSTTQSDRTRVGGGNIGGANFSAISEADPEYARKVWGVMDEGTASRLINLSSPETAWTTMLGSATQLKTNPVVFDKLKKQFIAAMKEGKLSKELESKINHNLELTFGEGAQIRDPNIWKEANTFEKRAALADVMMGQGIQPSKGGVALGGEKSGKGVVFKPTETLIEETEPSLIHPEHGGDAPTFALGPRLFNLSGTAEMRPDLHPGFPTLLHGKDLGYNFEPVPTEVFLPDWHANFKKKNPDQKAGYYHLALGLKGEGLPSQDLHDEYIRHLIREGRAEGGAVHMGKGGLLSKAARELEEAMTKLPRGSNAAQAKIEREFAEEAARKDALYKVDKPSGEVGNKAIAEAKRILSPSGGKDKFLEPSKVKQRLYHGTTKDIFEFDPSQASTKTGNPTSYFGTFLSDSPKEAGRYASDWNGGGTLGGNIMPVHAQIKNPYPMSYKEYDKFSNGEFNRFIKNPSEEFVEKNRREAMQDVLNRKQELINQGYDGIVVKIGGINEYVPFDPAQIKSAIGNRGTYDINEADITKAHGGVVHMAEGSRPPSPRKYVPPSQLIPIASQEFPLQKPANVTEADMTPTELHPLAGSLSRGVANVHEFVSKPFGYANPPMEMASELMGLPAISKTLENYAYGTPNTKGSGQATRLNEEAVDAAMSLPFGSGQAIKAGVKGAVKGAKELAPTAGKLAQEFAEKTQFGMPLELNVVPPSQAVGKAAEVKAPANDLGLYSVVEKAALNLQRKSGNGDAFLSDLMKNQGVSQARLDETGLTAALKGRKGVTREEVQQLAAEGKIPLQERVAKEFTEEPKSFQEHRDNVDRVNNKLTFYGRSIDTLKEDLNKSVQMYGENNVNASQLRDKIKLMEEAYQQTYDELNKLNRVDLNASAAKYGPESSPNFNTKGGENYREILIKTPEKVAEPINTSGWKVVTEDENKYSGQRVIKIYDENNNVVGQRSGYRGSDYDAIVNAAKTREKYETSEMNFGGSHHSDPNVLMHLRVADHVDSEGKRGLLIDELQSDWHQKGRDKGYGKKLVDMPHMSADELYDKHFNDLSLAQREYLEEFMKKWESAEYSGGDKELDKLTNQYQSWTNKQTLGKGVPDAPFKDDWYQLGLKRAIKEAADTGMDRVYLTTGKTQADRYDLSKHVNDLGYKPDGKGSGRLQAFDKNRITVLDENIPEEKLADYIGKDAAKKLLESEKVMGTHSLSNADLQVGGEGMRQYYDKTYLNYLKKYAKQHGAEVGMTTLPSARKSRVDLSGKEMHELMDNPEFKKILDEEFANDNNPNEKYAWNAALKRFGGQKVYYLDLNPALKNTAKKGQAFASGGAVQSPNGFDYESHVNNIMNAHNASNFDYEGHVKKIMGMAEGGAAYNTQPDMSDGGLSIPAAAFKIGGRIPLLTR